MRRAIQSEPTHYEVGKFYKVPCVWASWPVHRTQAPLVASARPPA